MTTDRKAKQHITHLLFPQITGDFISTRANIQRFYYIRAVFNTLRIKEPGYEVVKCATSYPGSFLRSLPPLHWQRLVYTCSSPFCFLSASWPRSVSLLVIYTKTKLKSVRLYYHRSSKLGLQYLCSSIILFNTPVYRLSGQNWSGIGVAPAPAAKYR